MNDVDVYLDGKALFGDDFNISQISEWFADEKEGYADLGAKDSEPSSYGYHSLNTFHGFKYLPKREFENALGFGSAYGEEFLPINSNIKAATIVDPSDAFVRDSVYGIPLTYVKPSPDGKLPFADDSFDLITCFGVLHHIPNVSSVVSDLARVLKPDGFLLLREPIISMGDWRKPRPGLTKRERGIPLHILENIVQSYKLEIVKSSFCDFPVVAHIFGKLGVYNTYLAALIDAWVSTAFSWNYNYHPRNTIQRFRPRSVFMVLKKA